MTLALSLAALLRPSQLGLALPADSGPRPPSGPTVLLVGVLVLAAIVGLVVLRRRRGGPR
ncbi:MAG TPA: hypothetical protein P5181_09640 [Dermatophilaceae bacterium]|nr:hypothetical protein [Dermatophilaceae bacterium]